VKNLEEKFKIMKNYLFTMTAAGKKYELKKIKKMMELLNFPNKHLKSIHVVGTNGKGSTSATLHAIFTEANIRAGLFTSPHLVDFRERIRVGEKNIGKYDFVNAMQTIKNVCENLGRMPEFGYPSFFETLTALAFQIFLKKNIEIGIFEAGLGGRLDATNVISPYLTIITDIGFDHRKTLGPRLIDIAKEKAAVIRKDVPVISSKQRKHILNYIKQKCKEQNSSLFILGEDFDVIPIEVNLEGSYFIYRWPGHRPYFLQKSVFKELKKGVKFFTPLSGYHQIKNAALAITAALLNKIPLEIIRRGLTHTKWFGRFQIIDREKLLIIDGAHNKDGVKALLKTMKFLKFKRLFLILGILSDKDVKSFAVGFKKLNPVVGVVKVKNKRAGPVFDLAHKLAIAGLNPDYVSNELSKMYNLFRGFQHSDDVLLITGSLYLLGEFLSLINSHLN